MGPLVAVTTGEPAGIGPDIALSLLAGANCKARLAVIADPDMLCERAKRLGIPFAPGDYEGSDSQVSLVPVRAVAKVEPGHADSRNADYVLRQIEHAVSGCLDKKYSSMVTGPVNKSVICRSGTRFTGHTEYLRDLVSAKDATMLFVNSKVRLGLATTHLRLSEVASAVDADLVLRKIKALADGIRRHFRIDRPRIRVTGLNPHAGEGGELGDEEQSEIRPAVEEARAQGYEVEGPVSADTAMVPETLDGQDVLLSMYHDQCLPAAKALDFHGTVNVTLGLPFVRTSVDHGTAETLAGTGKANPANLINAVRLAIDLSKQASA